jgi:hypothetical protein
MPQMISNVDGGMMNPDYEVIAVGQTGPSQLMISPDMLSSAASLESSLGAYSFASPTSVGAMQQLSMQPIFSSTLPHPSQQYQNQNNNNQLHFLNMHNLQQPMSRQHQPVPGSPLGPRPLTAAQKAALATINTVFPANQQHQQLASALPPLSPSMASKDQELLSQYGINTEGLTTSELRSLAQQMEGVSAGTASEIRRQMHIQCEQKRRAQIKDGFEELKTEMPGYQNKRVSKAVLLTKAVGYIRQLKAERMSMIAELERLRAIHATSAMLLHQHSDVSQVDQAQQPSK